MNLTRNLSVSTTRRTPLASGLVSFVLAIAGLSMLASNKQPARLAGLMLMFGSSITLWLADWAWHRSQPPRMPVGGRGRYMLIAFVLTGPLADLMPSHDRIGILRNLLVLLGRALAHQ
jgi:hypothetical protein